jgi:hypothetical protein
VRGIFGAVADEEDILPDPMSQSVAERWLILQILAVIIFVVVAPGLQPLLQGTAWF